MRIVVGWRAQAARRRASRRAAFTSNPAIGIGVGIAVQAATDEAVKRVMKSLHKDQQDAIAVTAGDVGDRRNAALEGQAHIAGRERSR